MNKRIVRASLCTLCTILVCLFAVGCQRKDGKAQDDKESATKEKSENRGDAEQESESGIFRTGDAKIDALLVSYPDFIKEVKDNKVVFKDGSTITYDDGKEKDFLTLLDNCDVEDMFYRPYRLPNPEPEYLEDVGRMRSETLYKKMYGSSEKEVRANLKNVKWFGTSVQFNSKNGAADSLLAVANEISKYADLRPYLKSSGTFNWRPVRGARRMSAHSYGIAFDIAVDKSDYWQWKTGGNDELKKVKYANKFPRKIVEIFQRHGFIWGGAWYHYDTMHFEFRPEILKYAEYTSK